MDNRREITKKQFPEMYEYEENTEDLIVNSKSESTDP